MVWRGALTLCVATLALVAVGFPSVRPLRAQSPHVQLKTFSVRALDGTRQSVLAAWPKRREGAERWPVLIAFHGMGESRKGPGVGYRAWVDDYALLSAYEALLAAPLSPVDFGGLVRERQLAVMNQDLARRAFRGLFVVGVYTPDLLTRQKRQPGALARYADWVADELIHDVHDTFPVTDPRRDATGVDGVSLGGFVSLSVGFRRPDTIGVVGAMQPAIRGGEERFAALAAAAARVRPQRIRLLTSDDDPLLGPTRKLSRELRQRHIPHELRVVVGPHGYEFNRGPGALDMLWYHDRALRAQVER